MDKKLIHLPPFYFMNSIQNAEHTRRNLNALVDILDHLHTKNTRPDVYYSSQIGVSGYNNSKEFDRLSRDLRIVLKSNLSVIDQYIFLEIVRYLWTRDYRTFRMCDTYDKLRVFAEENFHRMTYEEVTPVIRKRGIRWADESPRHDGGGQFVYTIADVQKILVHLLLWCG